MACAALVAYSLLRTFSAARLSSLLFDRTRPFASSRVSRIVAGPCAEGTGCSAEATAPVQRAPESTKRQRPLMETSQRWNTIPGPPWLNRGVRLTRCELAKSAPSLARADAALLEYVEPKRGG